MVFARGSALTLTLSQWERELFLLRANGRLPGTDRLQHSSIVDYGDAHHKREAGAIRGCECLPESEYGDPWSGLAGLWLHAGQLREMAADVIPG